MLLKGGKWETRGGIPEKGAGDGREYPCPPPHMQDPIYFSSGSGWFTTDPFDITDKFGGHWKTTDYKAGDVMIFTMR